jgi:hypothetical protein
MDFAQPRPEFNWHAQSLGKGGCRLGRPEEIARKDRSNAKWRDFLCERTELIESGCTETRIRMATEFASEIRFWVPDQDDGAHRCQTPHK